MTATAAQAQLDGLMDLVSPRVGLIRSLVRVQRGAGEPTPPIVYQATLSNFDLRTATPIERATAGKGVTDAEAMVAAIGEAIERYCAAHPDLPSIRRGTRRALGGQAVDPAACVLYSDRQYARPDFLWPRPTPDTDLPWRAARELPGDREVLVPATLVYMNYTGEQPGDHLCPSTSNGLAAGVDLEDAVLRGLCELIERDAFLIAWMNRLPAPEVLFEGGVPGSVRAHYARFGVDVRVFNLSSDLSPHVMMAVALDRLGHGPAAVIGLGCHLDPAAALIRALFEVCQARPGEARRYVDNPPHQRLRQHRDVVTLEDHSAFFTVAAHLGELAFLLDNGRRQRLEELPNHAGGSIRRDLATCVDTLTRAGARVLYADLTTPDVRDRGIRVVRTLATGLQPIHFGWGEERLGGDRLYEVPARLGHGGGRRSEADLNPCPHPLA